MKKFWEEGGGFFGRGYMEGDNSFEGYLSTPLSLNERTTREVEGIIKILKLYPGMRILDCPSGYGRHAIRLAELGFDVLGSDINGEMLQPAIRKSDGIRNVRFVQENMLNMSYREEFDAALNLFFSLGFFEDEEENNQVLLNFYNALKPGGKFLMHTDINIPRIQSGKYKLHERRHLRNGKELEIIESYEPDRKRLHGQWILINEDGTKEALTPYSHRIYTFTEFAHLCQATGFYKVEGYGAWDGSPLDDDSEDMIVVAEKRS